MALTFPFTLRIEADYQRVPREPFSESIVVLLVERKSDAKGLLTRLFIWDAIMGERLGRLVALQMSIR